MTPAFPSELSYHQECARLGGLPVVHDRERWIRDRCRGQVVLHVGCADREAFEQAPQRHLHRQLADVTARLAGIDVDAEGIVRLHDAGYTELMVADVGTAAGRKQALSLVQQLGRLDRIVAGDVVEHVEDPGRFVTGLVKLNRATGAPCILTTINHTYAGGFLDALRLRERVHPEHTAYYSMTTLKNLLLRCGATESMRFHYYTNPSPRPLRGIAKRAFTRMFPPLAEGLIVEFGS